MGETGQVKHFQELKGFLEEMIRCGFNRDSAVFYYNLIFQWMCWVTGIPAGKLTKWNDLNKDHFDESHLGQGLTYLSESLQTGWE